MKTTRRQLLGRFGMLPLVLALPKWLRAGPSKKKASKLVILHTNDTHSQIDPFAANHTKFPNQGGVSARAALVSEFRKNHEHVLLLDAGDFFQGTPYFNRFHGVLEMKVMSALKYDVVTLGNHDFDIGINGFMEAQKHANFKFVNANYDFGQTPMNEIVQPYQIIQKGPFQIGIFGIGINLNGLVPTSNFQGIHFKDPYQSARDVVTQLQERNCDIIICLSHLGYKYEDPSKPSDVNLAKVVSGIDFILGGHTHTFMEEPTKVKDPSGHDVWIHQVGWAGVRLGVIEIEDKNIRCSQSIVK
ncbi:MAG: bifunctional metallophosphatase/5'-nucleotidase [Sphingomonadales bacterium]